MISHHLIDFKPPRKKLLALKSIKILGIRSLKCI